MLLRFMCALTCLTPALTAAANICAPMTEKRKVALCRYVQRKYRLGEESRLTISEVSEINDRCYRKLRFVASGNRQFEVSLYLTPDQRFLLPELNDSALDPVIEEKRRLMEARRDLEEDDGLPLLGPKNAPVSIVVFSDFQCPYCRRLAETLKQIAWQEREVRILFRNMPLGNHSWAKQAAETAACVQMQNREAFWRVHDYLFEHQNELTPQNLLHQLTAYLGSIHTVRVEQVRKCVLEQQALPRIQLDLAVAAANKVHGTPTVFVNGQPLNGGTPTREHLLTLIRETLNEAAAATKPSQRRH